MRKLMLLAILLTGTCTIAQADTNSNTSSTLGSRIDRDLQLMQQFVNPSSPTPNTQLPPGLAKKEQLPPGLAKKNKIPPGWNKRQKEPDNTARSSPTIGNIIDDVLAK